MKRLALALFMLAGCAPDFMEPWEVDQPRLMGARVEVDGDAARSRPRLTERFSLRFFVGLPAGRWPTPLAGRYGFDVALCLGFKTSSGTLACIGEQDFNPTVMPLSDNEVLVSGLGLDLSALGELPLPSADAGAPSDVTAALRSIDRLALFGVFCVDGKPERVPGTRADSDAPSALYRCVPNAGATFTDATTFSMSVYLDRGLPIDANRSPTFACDSDSTTGACREGVQVGDEARVPGSFVIARPERDGQPREVVAWPSRDQGAALPWENCAADPALVQVRAKSGEHTFRARFDPADREPYQYVISVNGVDEVRSGREALLLTHALTLKGGSLGRFESKLDEVDPDSEAEISFSYTPPEKGEDASSIPENGRLVRFYFTLRDERGGVDFTTRELCLLPAAQGGR